LKCDAELLRAVNKYFCHSILIDVMWRRRRTATALPCLLELMWMIVYTYKKDSECGKVS